MLILVDWRSTINQLGIKLVDLIKQVKNIAQTQSVNKLNKIF